MSNPEWPGDPTAKAPSSREIHGAMAVLRRADADSQALRLLEIWNARRLVDAATRVSTHEELSNLFIGLPSAGKRSIPE
jgi:hypothetical protein